jgi:hypothetical protein
MEFDIDDFFIREQGFKEDYKRRKAFHKSTVENEFFQREQAMKLKHAQARESAKNSPGLDHMRTQAIKATEATIKRQTERLAQEKRNSWRELAKPDKDRLEELHFGGVGIRDKQKSLAEEYQRKQAEKASDKARTDFNVQTQRKKEGQNQSDLINKQEKNRKEFSDKKKLKQDNTSMEKTNEEKREAFYARVRQGRHAKKIDFQHLNDNSKGKQL